MTTRQPRRPKTLLATTAIAAILLSLPGPTLAQRGERRGDYDERRGGAEERRPYDGYDEREAPRGDGENSYTTRRGGTVDTEETTDGNTTTRDTTVTGADGETGTHDGTWNRDGDTTTYHGDTETSTGRDSNAAAAGAKTENGFVAHGAAVGDQGAAAGEVAKDGDQVEGRSVTTNGGTVNRNAVDCDRGDCTRATVDAARVPYGPAVPYFVPYRSYPCPGGTDMIPSTSGDIVYSCAVTPLVATTVPLGTAAASAQVTSSSVVMYQVPSGDAVYVTSYRPKGIYCQDVGGRCYWVPGAAVASPEVLADLSAAAGLAQPTGNATVITYTVGGDLVYLTGEPPAPGIYSQAANGLYAWMPGVTQPTDAQRGSIATSVTVHGQQGARALADLFRGG